MVFVHLFVDFNQVAQFFLLFLFLSLLLLLNLLKPDHNVFAFLLDPSADQRLFLIVLILQSLLLEVSFLSPGKLICSLFLLGLDGLPGPVVKGAVMIRMEVEWL